MSLHLVEYSYTIPESAAEILEIDPVLDQEEKEAVAIQLIKEIFDDVKDIEILSIKEKIYE